MAPYRVLVVDDSAFMRKIITDLIVRSPKFSVVATASTGAEAIEALLKWRPDVITMDLEMPELNGLEALKRIMRVKPTPVIMLAGISEDGTKETIKALQLGAFDFIRKPTSATHVEKLGRLLHEKLLIAVQTSHRHQAWRMVDPTIYRRPLPLPERKPLPPPKEAQKPPAPLPVKKERQPAKPQAGAVPPRKEKAHTAAAEAGLSGIFEDIVAVGTSTGGPRALHQLIASLPAHFPAPVLVVQHMPPKFTRSLAQRLDSFSKLRVVEASQGEPVLAGTVYIAPGGYHMALAQESKGFAIRLTEDAPRGGHRPSVDVLFESLLPHTRLRQHAVVMTGMGSDGSAGLHALTRRGIATAIAEAEQSCVVYGMPRAAVERGGATTVLPVHEIAAYLVRAVQTGREG
ncbi:chemotaxis response regulator protein-glutamate methylesterase [Paenibacillus sp. IB182496]|uniref:Protein-glutamate methylesterase/protein-glutamine glutaminase n=1 Tax=Paenibacillus sabuli TaxID=2772509 RepID=A0A927GRA6_9BACL|nr:chemotaxis response regulator protein-glutamate methylesterase [Paenibacillus sabuli]MBD2845268.1 chemotaxis response regulator protein-glutamate methylesterase [Paenibacillus sabuli]